MWHLSNRAAPAPRAIADRHYNRQSIGAVNFAPPGRCLVLVIPDVALWITSWPFAEYVKHAWPGAWICSAFRNERPDLHRSSDLIREALAATRWRWPDVPALGMITFVDTTKTRHKRDPGRCYRKAGFHRPVSCGFSLALDVALVDAGCGFLAEPTDRAASLVVALASMAVRGAALGPSRDRGRAGRAATDTGPDAAGRAAHRWRDATATCDGATGGRMSKRMAKVTAAAERLRAAIGDLPGRLSPKESVGD